MLPQYEVTGKITSRNSASVGGLRVLLLDKGIVETPPLAETTSTEDGSYQLSFDASQLEPHKKTRPDLQVQVRVGETVVGNSEVRYNAGLNETLNVTLADNAIATLPSEHKTLTDALTKHASGKALRDLKEDQKHQDITYLANKTGWDARAVAMAALADQLSQDSGGLTAGIAAPFFYALLRAGLPANKDTLFHTDAQTLGRIWKQAVSQGVIPKESEQFISDHIGTFRTLSARALLSAPAQVGASSFKQLLEERSL
jgi:hypothetical protein